MGYQPDQLPNRGIDPVAKSYQEKGPDDIADHLVSNLQPHRRLGQEHAIEVDNGED